jgi:3-oxoacyl-[acyl-carrier protein] reductase
MTQGIGADLAGRAVLVTGASTGIGAAAARAFATLGCKVAIHYNASRNRAEEVAADVRLAGGQAHLVGGDFTDSAAVRRVIDEAAGALGGIDVLINNAGSLVRRVPIAEIDDTFFDEVISTSGRS